MITKSPQTKYIRIRAKTYKMQSTLNSRGTKMSIRAIKAVIRRGFDVLVLKKSDLVEIYPGQWDLPGGRLNPDESWCDGLAREVQEETGLHVKFLCEIRTWENTRWDTLGKTVLCDYIAGDVILSWEHTEFFWVPMKEVETGEFPQWIRNDVKAALDADE